MERIPMSFEGVDLKPSEFTFTKYILLGGFGKGEAEEFMLRFVELTQISSSQTGKDEWVALSVKDMDERLNSDYNDLLRANEITQNNAEKRRNYDRECRRLRNRIKALFGTKVPEPEYEKDIDVPVFTNLWLGPQTMAIGLDHLLKNNYLETMDVKGETYLRPTIKGVKRLESFVKKEN